eukprot:752218-Hanusia_phi.AAC.7
MDVSYARGCGNRAGGFVGDEGRNLRYFRRSSWRGATMARRRCCYLGEAEPKALTPASCRTRMTRGEQ